MRTRSISSRRLHRLRPSDNSSVRSSSSRRSVILLGYIQLIQSIQSRSSIAPVEELLSCCASGFREHRSYRRRRLIA
ncbi:unnamed protein product [Linum trigynum]|uniref:Uncharacterized protein n=1 Tax=Linum trigynum TaxID=586398 RepID=A0AAV2FT84_9ROSI